MKRRPYLEATDQDLPRHFIGFHEGRDVAPVFTIDAEQAINQAHGTQVRSTGTRIMHLDRRMVPERISDGNPDIEERTDGRAVRIQSLVKNLDSELDRLPVEAAMWKRSATHQDNRIEQDTGRCLERANAHFERLLRKPHRPMTSGPS